MKIPHTYSNPYYKFNMFHPLSCSIEVNIYILSLKYQNIDDRHNPDTLQDKNM